MVIYKITSTLNSKAYMGQIVQSVQKRWNFIPKKGDMKHG